MKHVRVHITSNPKSLPFDFQLLKHASADTASSSSAEKPFLTFHNASLIHSEAEHDTTVMAMKPQTSKSPYVVSDGTLGIGPALGSSLT